jgi:hypothetical protein
MSAFELQNAIGDTLLEMVLQQKAQAKKQRELLVIQQAVSTGLSSKVYAKAA